MYVILDNVSFNTDSVDVITIETHKNSISVVMYVKGNKHILHSINSSILEDITGANPILIVKYFYDNVMKLALDKKVLDFRQMESKLQIIIESYLKALSDSKSYQKSVEYIVNNNSIDADIVTLKEHLNNVAEIEKLKREEAYAEINNLY